MGTLFTRFYLILYGFFLAALAAGAAHFFLGLEDSAYLVSDGVHLRLVQQDAQRYQANLQGLVFALSFLGPGLLMGVFMLLPGAESAAELRPEAPQPRRRAEPPWPEAQRQAAQLATQQGSAFAGEPVPPAGEPPPPAPAEAAWPGVSPGLAGGTAPPAGQAESAAERPAPPGAAEPAANGLAPGLASEENAKTGAQLEAELVQQEEEEEEELDLSPQVGRFHAESDVVYGDGPITDDAMWFFTRNHPESAIKFLFRKTLSNRGLSPQDESVYARWEERGMTRGRLRRVVLEIMGLAALPGGYPHSIWQQLRDVVVAMQQQEERQQRRAEAEQSILGLGRSRPPKARRLLRSASAR